MTDVQLDEARALLAALKEEHRPADELRAQLLAEIEAHAETKAEVERLREALRVAAAGVCFARAACACATCAARNALKEVAP